MFNPQSPLCLERDGNGITQYVHTQCLINNNNNLNQPILQLTLILLPRKLCNNLFKINQIVVIIITILFISLNSRSFQVSASISDNNQTLTHQSSNNNSNGQSTCGVNCILPFILVPVGLILVFCVLPICAFGIHKTISEGDWSSNCCFKVLDLLNGKNPCSTTAESVSNSDQLDEGSDGAVGVSNTTNHGQDQVSNGNSLRFTESSMVHEQDYSMNSNNQDSITDYQNSTTAQQTEAVVYYYSSSVNHV